MGVLGFGRTTIPYDMFDLHRSAEEAKRYAKCERIYHKGQQLAWDGKEILPMLIEKHGGVRIDDPAKAKALERIFAIILWGELAAWKISAQLADRLEPLEAKMAATSQAFDEARHFYTMYDYLQQLGYVPERLDRAPQALLDLTLDTDDVANKLLGMQLTIEVIALAIFQAVREIEVEPVLTELMTYYERDEARHVGLGMQYLPELMKDMTPKRIAAMMLFQSRLIAYALWENKVLEQDLRTLGIDPRFVIERGRQKQIIAVREAFEAIGIDVRKDRSPAMQGIAALIELMFPTPQTQRASDRMRAAWDALRDVPEVTEPEALDTHARHAIKTARGFVDRGETTVG